MKNSNNLLLADNGKTEVQNKKSVFTLIKSMIVIIMLSGMFLMSSCFIDGGGHERGGWGGGGWGGHGDRHSSEGGHEGHSGHGNHEGHR